MLRGGGRVGTPAGVMRPGLLLVRPCEGPLAVLEGVVRDAAPAGMSVAAAVEARVPVAGRGYGRGVAGLVGAGSVHPRVEVVLLLPVLVVPQPLLVQLVLVQQALVVVVVEGVVGLLLAVDVVLKVGLGDPGLLELVLLLHHVLAEGRGGMHLGLPVVGGARGWQEAAAAAAVAVVVPAPLGGRGAPQGREGGPARRGGPPAKGRAGSHLAADLPGRPLQREGGGVLAQRLVGGRQLQGG